MSDSEELLFGNITDADAEPSQSDDNDAKKNAQTTINGTSYPQKLTTIALEDSDSNSDSNQLHQHSSHSNGGAIQIISPSRSSRKSRSRKRIKDIDYQSCITKDDDRAGEAANSHTATQNTDGTQAGELSTDPQQTQYDTLDINHLSSPKQRRKSSFLTGKTHKNHHRIADKDSEEEDESDEDEEDDDELVTQMSPTKSSSSCGSKCSFFASTMSNNGHTISVVLTVFVMVSILGCISGKLAALTVFLVCYVLYLIECLVNKTWKELNDNQEIADATVKLLDTLKDTPPVIDWYVESYHYETNNIPPTGRKTIVWVHGKPEHGGHKLEALGFEIKYFKWDWNAINYVAEKENQCNICAIVLPDGYEGTRIQQSMLEKLETDEPSQRQLREPSSQQQSLQQVPLNDTEDDEKVAIQVHDDEEDADDDEAYSDALNRTDSTTMSVGIGSEDGDAPYFLRWYGDIEQLMDKLREKGVIKEDRKKVVTHSAQKVYDYREWKDISLNYPDLNRYEIMKLSIEKTYCMSNEETRNHYNEQKQLFLNRNNKDEYQAFHENMIIRGYKNCFTIKKYDPLYGEMNKTPFWCTIHGYWVYSVFLMTLYPRYKCATMFGRAEWKIIKSISI
eukprot:CAMPEP_0197025232 /NCGR_PEP_ID=MMETSP1384-20130603/5629_1 /TAXON_ID=29189 /ORGANISM="Ammonia sp." /LENGTH=619 /DNA_ID=CAMNT_0042453739 /DNA_START=25 /DNA_END=1884 /DNA_ORIENTATION=+